MAQKRVDVLNRSGGPLFETNLPKNSTATNSTTTTAKTNSGLTKREEKVKKKRTALNRTIQEAKSINKQLDHIKGAKLTGLLDAVSNVTQQRKDEYEKNDSEENEKALKAATKALGLTQSNVSKILAEQNVNSQKMQEDKSDYDRSVEAYKKYMLSVMKSDKYVSQKPQPIYTLDDLSFQKDVLKAEEFEKQLPGLRSQLEQDFDWTSSSEREKRKQLEDEVENAESFVSYVRNTQETNKTLTDFYKLPEEDRNNIITFAASKNAENFKFLEGITGANAVDVVWVPGQGVQPVSDTYRSNIAFSDLLKKGYQPWEIHKMADAYLRNANAEAAEKIEASAKELATKTPIIANIARQPLNLVGGLASGIDYGVESLKSLLDSSKRNVPMDANRLGSTLSNASDTIYSTSKENINSKALKVAYGAGTALVDNIVRFYAGGGTKAGTLSLGGLSSFGSGAQEASSRGATASQAAMKGLTDAASEVITELLPLDNIIKLKSSDIGKVANILKEGLKQAGIEVATEEINYGIGLLSDWLIMGDKSQANLQKRELMEGGLSEKDAEKQVVNNILSEAGNLAIETALSSFAQAGIEGGANLYRAKNSQNAPQQQTQQTEQAPIRQQEVSPQPIAREPITVSPVQKAVDNVKSGTPVSNSQAEAILQNTDVLSELSQKTGVQFGGTKSEMRQQVKQAIYSLAQNENIDVTNKEVYDDKNNIGGIGYGLQDNDRRTSSGNLAERVAGVQRNNGNDAERGREYGQVALNSGVVRVSDQIQKARTERGIQSYEMFDTTSDPQSYEQALTDGRNSDTENGWCVTPKSAQELVDGNVRTMMNENKTVGVGVASDGDIVAVFKNKNGGPKRALDTAMPMAIENGGDRLDCYGEGLVRVYSEYGFVPVARVEFNPEYANDGWTPDKGTPYIYFMMHNGDSAADVVQKMHTYPKYTKEQLDALPTFGKEDYDAAMDYRNELIDQRKNEAKREGASKIKIPDNAGSVDTKNEAVGAADRNFTGLADYDSLLTDDNVQPPRASDAKHEEVPKVDAYGNKVSENASNVMNSDIISERDVNNVKKMIAEGLYGHQTQKMEDVQKQVSKELEGKSLSSAVHNLTQRVAKGKISEHDIAEAQILLAHYTQKEGKAAETMAAELFVDLSQMATQSGRQLNMFKLLRQMTPEGQTLTVKRSAEKYVESLNNKRSKNNKVTVDIPQELLDAHSQAAREAMSEDATEEMNAAVDKAERDIQLYVASQIKSTLKEKWDALRHMAMLGNIKTQERNFGGSAIFKPFVTTKRLIGAGLEKILKVPQEQRTKSVLGLGKDANLYRQLAKEDAKSQQAKERLEYSAITSESAESKAAREISENRVIYDYRADKDTSKTPELIKKAWEKVNEGLEASRKGLTALMEKTDMIFKRWEYSASLASFIKARGYTATQWQKGDVPASVLEEARAYAAKEAMKATFNDQNVVSDVVSKLARKADEIPVVNIAFGGVLPYTKTPANAAVRAFEYSPANVVRSAVNALGKVKNGDMPAAECIDQLASGLTGTGAMVLGAALASGIFGVKLVGALDDEDEERVGHQKYSLEFGDTSVTIDWAAPSVIPLFVGANLYNKFSGDDPSTASWIAKVASSVVTTFEPMLELSCLSALNDLFETARTAKDGESLYAVAANIATSYFTQALPTLGAQFDQLGDKTRQKIYATSEDPFERSLQKLAGKVTQRLPGDAYQTEYVDAWGRTENTNWFESIFSPSYFNKINTTDVDKEIMRLNDVQDENVSPSTPGYTVTVDGKQRRLTAEEWTELAKAKGQKAYKIVSELIESEDYQKLTDVEKAKAIRSAYEYAGEFAKVSELSDYNQYSAKWMEDISGSEAKVILNREIISSSGLSDARYERAKEKGVDLSQMQEVSSQVKQQLKGKENKTDYDTYRAVLETVPEDETDKWLEIYGMSESRLEQMDSARKNGISGEVFVDYLQVDSKLDKAFKEITTAWKEDETPSLDSLSDAYDAYESLPIKAQKYFEENVSGRLGAFVNAMDSGVSESTFIGLYKQYYDMSNDDVSASKDATNWAMILDQAKSKGKITEKQREILWNDLGFYTQIRQEAKKYYDLTQEGLKPDVAAMVTNMMSGLEKTKDQLNTIADSDLSEEQKTAAVYAYLDDKQDKKFKAITDLGVDVETYAALYGLYSEESGDGKKARVVEKYVREYNLSDSAARKIYDIYSGKK